MFPTGKMQIDEGGPPSSPNQPNWLNLLHGQKRCFQAIKSIKCNFKKDGPSRRTPDYLKRRLDALETHWMEFEANNDLLQQMEDEENEYFREDIYNKTKAMYDAAKQEIMTSQLALSLGVQAEASKKMDGEVTVQTSKLTDLVKNQSEAETGSGGALSEEMKSLLRQQLLNFNALESAVSKINLNNIEEKWELEDCLNILKTRWNTIDKLHWELSFGLGGSVPTYEKEYEKWENTYDTLKKNLNKKIWASAHFQKATPQMELPEFDGNYNKWVSFRDLFRETVHTNPLLSKSQRMQHLKSKLRGEAERLIQHLTISAENYDSCWDIIQHRYENKKLLFSSYVNTLLALPVIQQPNSFNIKKIHDTIKECVNGLNNLGVNISTWDPLLVHLLLPKLDTTTYNEYTQSLENPRELPNLRELTDFLEAKFIAFESVKQNQQGGYNRNEQQPKKQVPWQQKHYQKNFNFHNKFNEPRSSNNIKHEKWTKSYHATFKTCPLCKKGHVLMYCDMFLNMDVAARNENIAKLQLCRNCLFSHNGKQCTSTKNCKLCDMSHHTLLHRDNLENFKSQRPGFSQPQASTSTQRSANHINNDNQEILLTTVKLMVSNIEGKYVALRALLDQGSQVSLITENAAQRLRLPRRKLSAVISGVGSSEGNSKGCLSIECKSIHSDFTFKTEVLIMNKLINNLPQTTLSKTKWEHLENLKLADPDFFVSSPIDILLGADVYSMIIDDGLLKGDNSSPVAQRTKLGWILCGNVKTFNCLATLNELENLNRFWETEEINVENEPTPSDDYCEKHYLQTTERMSTGQYVVKMPLKNDIQHKLGKSRPQAISQFLQLEKKMARQEHFAEQYKQFIAEYQELGHMKPATRSTTTQLQSYLPHHGVIREGSTTKKLRVVFNASSKSDTPYSLNDLMEKGPNLQKDIVSLILTWRSYKYALTADIEKMFRAIFLHEEQQPLQKIIWRSTPQEQLREMQLCTVTYGTKAAPFLAMRTLQQLAEDEGHAYPSAAQALRNQFYMDDVITGHNTIEGATQLQKQLYSLLKKGGFTLRKWASNEPAVLKHQTDEHKSQTNIFNFSPDEHIKTLGLGWNKTEDLFCFDWELPTNNKAHDTKRRMLADISRIFDPLGWLAPITVYTKLLFQQVWSAKTAWDEPIPENIAQDWEKIRSQLKLIKNITLPRWINCVNKVIELHGFCDASEKAYSCVIYSRTVNEQGKPVITLLTAKTKVCPLKKKLSIPKAELCSALLLAKLMAKVKHALANNELRVHCWTDSQVVLAWLQGNSKKWEIFVSNRTTMINNIIPATHWRHVKTKENAADCASRGLLPSQLVNFKLWWEGPQWLKTWTENEPQQKFYTENGKAYECNTTQKQYNNNIINGILQRCSSLTRATRSGNHLTMKELDMANKLLTKTIQRENFSMEIDCLKKGEPVCKKSKILDLTPFLDEHGILRVKGRLRHSALPEESKYPAILPHSGHYTQLVINLAHKQVLHGGARLTLGQTRQQYWILGGNRAVKGFIRRCVTCLRYKTTKNEQIMGNLPRARVTPSRPFTHTGVDFTGHVEIKLNKGRGVTTSKGYIAIFICLATKAVHIELVSDLSSETFLEALKRMCARRGTPKHIYSDNGTNFKGAAKILQNEFQVYQTLTSPEFFRKVNDLQIEWHFICPRWPSAGGIWEAAVKSMKQHLMRVLKDEKLTFEQFTTLLAQIEACMNSRPLCPITEDVEDLDYLTPGHFLTGTPMMSLPRENLNEQNIDLRNRWKRVELMHQHIWNRWSKEYLHHLQTKSKWRNPKENIRQGDLVLVKEDNVPPGRWAMGRVVDLHPGEDGYVRVVTLKTQTGNFKRPIIKLVPLPKENVWTADSEGKQPRDPQTNKNSNINNQKHETKTRGGKLGSHVTMFLLSLLTLFTCANTQPMQYFNITPIDGNKPIYFDKIGNLQLIHDEWTLLVYYNLTTYWQTTSNIKKYINNLENICARLENKPCKPTIAHLQHELQQITDYNSLLLRQHLNRKKRGYFNGVGNLAHTLFGVLDENFADKYQDDIAKIQTNENYLLELLKNQTSIVETENNIIKNNENFMKTQLESIHSYIEMTNRTLEKIVYRVETMATMNDLNAASITASLVLWNLKQTQDTLLNTLTNVHNGHLDVHLLTPKQLAREMNTIAARISKRLTLPVKNIEDNIKDVYRLLYVRARITSSYLLLEVHIPLMSDDEYNIYKILPLLMYGPNKEPIAVTPTSTHIAVNFGKETFIKIEEKDLDQCTKMKETNLICNTNYPIYKLRNENAPCEAEVLGQQTSRHCHITKVKCIDAWIKLHKRNRWLYLCCSTCHARVLCDDQITSIKISNIGTIDLKDGCILQKKDTTLFAYNHFGSKVELEPDVLDIPDVNFHLNEDIQFNLSSIFMPPITYNQTKEQEQLDRKLQLQKQNEKLPAAEIDAHDIHQYTILYLLVVAALAVAIYLIVRHCRQRIKKPDASPTEYRIPQQKTVENLPVADLQMEERVNTIYQEIKQSKRPTRQMFNLDSD